MNLFTAVLVPATITFAASLSGCDVQSSDASAGNVSTVTSPAEAAPAPASAPEPKPEPKPEPEPEPKPEPKPEPASSGPVVADLPGGAIIGDGTMKELASGLWIGTVKESKSEDAPVLADDARGVSIQMEAWNMHGDHAHGIIPAREMVMPFDDKMVFAGWTGALGGMKLGSTRKIWAPPGSEISKQLSNPGSPIVLEITLNGIDEFITLPETLPGADIGESKMQSSETGLSWYDVVVGDGPSPSPTDSVKVHYTGWLVNDLKFDSSVDRGVPFTVNMQGGVIAGWLEGLKTMRVGGTRKLIIPAELAYGWKPSSGPIPAGATLIFDVEMVEIVGPDVPAGDGGK